MAFPSSPTNGQVAVQNGITYTYDSTYSTWTRNPATLPSLSVYIDTFTGDGVTTSFTLSITPSSADFISINIDGVSQLKSAYTLSTNIVTFTGIPDVGAVIEIKSWNAASVGVLTGLTFDSFTGNGSGTTYTLSTSPTNKNYTLVTVGGITQEKVNYGVSGTTLTFTTPPPNTSPIEVMTFGPAVNSALAGGSNTQVQFNNQGTLSGSSFLTFNNSTNTLSTGNISVTGNTTVTGNVSANNFIGNGSSLTNIAGANVIGQIPNALVSGTVYSSAQPNITSVGSLTGLNIAGTLTYNAVVEPLVTKTGATGTVVHDVSQAATFYHTSMTSNFTASFSNVSTVDARITVVSLVLIQGATARVPAANVIVNGNAQTVKWYASNSPTGIANATEILSYTFIKANNNFTAFAQFSTFT